MKLFALPSFRTLALVSLAALGACSSAGVVPQVQHPTASIAGGRVQTAVLVGSADLRPSAVSCVVPMFWLFRGSCANVVLKRTGATVKLAAYKGLALSEVFGKNTLPGDKIVVVDGTGPSNITGKAGGVLFPPYGSVGCVTLSGSKTRCPGKAFLYTLLANITSGLTWASTPRFTIVKAGAFPGTKCELIDLYATQGHYVWVVLPVYATPSNGSVSFAPWTQTISAQKVFGFICS